MPTKTEDKSPCCSDMKTFGGILGTNLTRTSTGLVYGLVMLGFAVPWKWTFELIVRSYLQCSMDGTISRDFSAPDSVMISLYLIG
jgi:hypothetical protein